MIRDGLLHIGKYRIGIECGQHIWRPYSWRVTWQGIRRFNRGFAIGPIITWKETP